MSEQPGDEVNQVLNRIVEIVREHPEADWERLIHDLVPEHLSSDLGLRYGIEAICGARSASSGKLFPYQRGEK